MQQRPIAITIAGFDPSGGAGLIADVKTMEVHGVYAYAVCTAITCQNSTTVNWVKWSSIDEITQQLSCILEEAVPSVIKIGILPNANYLTTLLDFMQAVLPNVFIIWDPIIVSSSGTVFMSIDKAAFEEICTKIDVITPNWNELNYFENKVETYACSLSYKTKVVLKGGHRVKKKGIDTLYENGVHTDFLPHSDKPFFEKHGSGCVFSSAIAAHIALGKKLPIALKKTKQYIEKFASSNTSLLGYHF